MSLFLKIMIVDTVMPFILFIKPKKSYLKKLQGCFEKSGKVSFEFVAILFFVEITKLKVKIKLLWKDARRVPNDHVLFFPSPERKYTCHSLHWSITPPPLKNTNPSFLLSPLLKLANCPSLPLLGNPPSILVFREPP